MSGTRAGGLKAARKNKKKFGRDHYKSIGALGGSKSRGGGFRSGSPVASAAGTRGGRKSVHVRRAKKLARLKDELADFPGLYEDPAFMEKYRALQVQVKLDTESSAADDQPL